MHSRPLIDAMGLGRPKRRPPFAALGLLALVAIALPVRADDPPGAPHGQYDFFDSNSLTIRDTKTKLRWTRSASAGPLDFATAKSTCTGTSRLPTLKELLTLVDEQPHLQYDERLGRTVTNMIDPQAFDATTPVDFPYWTSSMDGTGTDKAWTVDFSTGMTESTRLGDARYVRCVTYAP